MKIFWSWQSDTPGKTGRHLVRDALLEAVEKLKIDVGIDEPAPRDLHVDFDRKGVPGSPDLARTIFDKIRSTSIMVADVTPIATIENCGSSSSGKRVMNPNVAIELGYGLHSLSDSNVLMVLNTYYGGPEKLPFDLRHKT
jgi:hypothetical protein